MTNSPKGSIILRVLNKSNFDLLACSLDFNTESILAIVAISGGLINNVGISKYELQVTALYLVNFTSVSIPAIGEKKAKILNVIQMQMTASEASLICIILLTS